MNREQWLKVAELKGCGRIPCFVLITDAVWKQWPDKVDAIKQRYPELFTDHLGIGGLPVEQPRYKGGQTQIDRWGCVWTNSYDGIEGVVTQHRLDDWAGLKDLKVPDPAVEGHMADIDWEQTALHIRKRKAEGKLACGFVFHGFLFQRLYYLRGFENLMIDIATKDKNLDRLIDIVSAFNKELVARYLALGVDVMWFGDDLGTQTSLTIGPDDFRRYIKPAYAEIFKMCRQAGTHVYLHTDGYIVEIMPDLIETGVTIINPQDICNGLENIKKHLKGKICIDLDIDRQSIVPFGTARRIDDHIRNYVETLRSPEGGLMLVCGIYPGTGLENIEAVCAAIDKYRQISGEML
jgi:hypothetical protein